MFNDEMAVQQNGFDASEQGIVGVQIGPACLHHADFFAAVAIHEIRNGAAKKIGLRDEVGVKDGDEFALCGVQAIFECASFVASAFAAVDVDDRETSGGVAGDSASSNHANLASHI